MNNIFASFADVTTLMELSTISIPVLMIAGPSCDPSSSLKDYTHLFKSDLLNLEIYPIAGACHDPWYSHSGDFFERCVAIIQKIWGNWLAVIAVAITNISTGCGCLRISAGIKQQSPAGESIGTTGGKSSSFPTHPLRPIQMPPVSACACDSVADRGTGVYKLHSWRRSWHGRDTSGFEGISFSLLKMVTSSGIIAAKSGGAGCFLLDKYSWLIRWASK